MSDALLDVRGISVRFGGLVAVNDVSLRLPKGAIYGVIGPNGAGKTTFFNAITGLVAIGGGSIEFAGQPIAGLSPPARASRGMRRTFQSVQLIPQFTVLENVLIGLHNESRDNPLTWIFSLSGRSRAEEAAQERVIEVLRFLGIEDTLFRRPQQLTFAEQRFAEIARALVSKPRLLMLDEPAAGLSPTEVAAINTMLRKVRAEWGTTILLVEHVLSLVLDVSDHITVLDNGRVISTGKPHEVSADPKVKAAYLGEEQHA